MSPKLQLTLINDIRKSLINENLSSRETGRKFNVSEGMVRKIKNEMHKVIENDENKKLNEQDPTIHYKFQLVVGINKMSHISNFRTQRGICEFFFTERNTLIDSKGYLMIDGYCKECRKIYDKNRKNNNIKKCRKGEHYNECYPVLFISVYLKQILICTELNQLSNLSQIYDNYILTVVQNLKDNGIKNIMS
uniref:HTH psq-type domain-containing protein n=1 Tax=Strongyloides papillosus TaxID=174720 RepID=A0A0N5BEE0_STREA